MDPKEDFKDNFKEEFNEDIKGLQRGPNYPLSTYMRQFYRNLKRKGKKEGFT